MSAKIHHLVLEKQNANVPHRTSVRVVTNTLLDVRAEPTLWHVAGMVEFSDRNGD